MTAALFDELTKMAEVQPVTWPRVRKALGNAVLGGAAAGLGGATGHLLSNAVLPRVLPKASPRTLAVLSGLGVGLGAAGSLAAGAALARNRKMVEEAR